MSETSGAQYLYDAQERLQAEVLSQLELGEFSEVGRLLDEAGEYRERFIGAHPGQISAVDAEVSFNETLHTVLYDLTGQGSETVARDLAADRLRTTSSPYELSALHHWSASEAAHAGRLQDAEAHGLASERAAEVIGSHWLAAQAERFLARLYSDMGNEQAAQQALAKALDNLERGQDSELYLPDYYKGKIAYGVKHTLRYYLGQRMFAGQEREMRHFCNEVLTASGDPSRRGFFHHWMGQAEIMHMKRISKLAPHYDATRAASHLKLAEEYFREAGEPVYAAFVVLDQGWLGDMPRALERARVHINAAIEEYEEERFPELAMEIDDVVKSLKDNELRLFTSRN